MTAKRQLRRTSVLMQAVAVVAAALPVWAGTSNNTSGVATLNNPGNAANPNAAVTISLSGSTAMRNFTTSAGITLLTPGTSITLHNGTAGAGTTYIATNDGFTQYQLASRNFTAADTYSNPQAGTNPPALDSQNNSAIRLEWHEQGSVEGILDMTNDQIGYYGALPLVDPATRNPVQQAGTNTFSNPTWVNGVSFNGTAGHSVGPVAGAGSTVNGFFLAQSDYNTYSAANYNLATGQNLQSGQNRVQMAVSDVNAVQGFAISGATGATGLTPLTPGYGKGNPGLAVGSLPSNALATPHSAWQFNDQSVLNMQSDKVNPQSTTGATYPVGPWNNAGLGNLVSTQVAVTATLFVANPGTGLTKLNRSDAQWLQTTGRLQNGAAFNFTTRDVGSGTRNVAALNTGIDPTWAVGVNDAGNGNDQIAGQTATDQCNIGPMMLFSNKTAGGGQLRPTVQNNRMAVGTLSMSDSLSSVNVSTATTPLRALSYSDSTDGSSGYVGVSAATITDGTYALYQNENYVTIKAPDASYNSPNPNIKGDNQGDVAAFRANVTNAVANFPAPASPANPADQLLNAGFILPAMMQKEKTVDGINQSVPNPNYNAALRAGLLGSPAYANKFLAVDPSTTTSGVGSTYGNGNGSSSNTAFFNGQIAITAKNYLFGNFNQNGERDFSALQTAQVAQAALFAQAGSSVFTADGGQANSTLVATGVNALDTMNSGGKATKGDLIVMGDLNGDGKFDGKDLYLFATGAALADNVGGTTLTAASGATLDDQIKNGVLVKNAALDWLNTHATAQQKIDASANLANDATGANAFNKCDVNRDGKITLDDAFIIDKFANLDPKNMSQVLSATIGSDGTISSSATQVQFNPINAKLIDGMATVGQADMDTLDQATNGLSGVFSHTWANTSKNGSLSIQPAPAAGSKFTVPAGTTLTVNAGSFIAGGAVDPFTDNSGSATNGNHLNVVVAPGATLGVAAGGGTKNMGALSLSGSGTATVQVGASGGAAGDVLQTSGAVTVAAGQTLTKLGAGDLVANSVAAAGTMNVAEGRLRTNGMSSIANLTGNGTTDVQTGTLAITSGNVPAGPQITIQDGATLQAQGTVQAAVSAPGASNGGKLQATGALALINFSGPANFNGQLDAQGNFVQVVSPVQSQIRSITLGNGAQVSSGGGIAMPTKGSGTAAGTTGQITLASSATATIGGNFQGGFVSGNSVSVRGVLGHPGSLTFTGVVKGGVSSTYASVSYTGSYQPGFSPVFVSNAAAPQVMPLSTSFAVNSAVAYVPDIASTLSLSQPAGMNGGYYQDLICGVKADDGTVYPGSADFFSGTIFKWAADSTFTAANAQAGQVFEIIRTDGHNWGADPGQGITYIDGYLTDYNNITLASFQNLP
ncbi:MAG: hypothetical protein ABSH20_14165, partial [Tepidisphaeraceae bacterium]